MAISPFSIIVAIDGGNGIAKDGDIPWSSPKDMKFFRDTTFGHGKNAVIMGRVTYETIPVDYRPLKGRHCIIVSRTWKQEDHPEISVCHSLLEALISAGGNKGFEEIFIAGGEQIYHESLRDFMYLCRRIYVTRFKTDYECDQFFDWDAVKNLGTFLNTQKTRDYNRHFIAPAVSHQEYQYLGFLREIMDTGEKRPDRTGVGTISKFGMKMEFDISERLPILTTKKVNYDIVIKELLFFISGKSDTKILEEQGVKIWKGNTSRDFLDSRGLDYEEGDFGPAYGFQWRHWGAKYKGAEFDYTDEGVDQITELIKGIQEDPHSRRHILSAWNVSQLQEMALFPCHIFAQFYVSSDKKYLDCQLYQRSGDGFLGVPFNIASYSILTYMIAHLTGLQPRKFIHIIGDAHIYLNHINQVSRQLSRCPRPLPRMRFRRATKIHSIDDFTIDSFIIENYSSWPRITGKMAV